MMKYSCLRPVALAALLAWPATSTAEDAATIVVRLIGVQAAEGNIVCRLFDADGWLGAPLETAKTAPQTPKVTFAPRPSGRYAVACFHDSDGNGQLTFGMFWRPKEGNGFSQGYRPFGPPKFEKAAFDAAGKTSVDVPLNYP